ncbi:MAG: dihydrolipoamide acetyltransferase family protein [Candidatus Thermoplasmatota archaeon]|nr:dihydrolipoamide acetyltransferase family protein [Candidatus Thermoplasmatota archaeon]MEC7198421.1 dihydrolipoamide acetyltransferase family protein [Candidatus Thermoplasmatota archaeon]
MARKAFKLPDIGEGVVEGEIVTWHVEVGSPVSEDDAIVDVMTDKSTVTIPSPYSGTIVALNGEVGDMVAVGAVLVEFESAGESGSEPEASPEPVEAEPSEEVMPEAPKTEEKEEESRSPQPTKPAVAPTATAPRAANSTVLASPAVRRRARETGIDLSMVVGSGRGGRIQQSDLDAALATGGSSPSAPRSVKRVGTREMKVVGLRRKIAEQMVISTSSIPHFSYFEEVDVTALEELRQLLNSGRVEGQPKLTYLPFIMLALSKAFERHKKCNAVFDDESGVVTEHDAVNLGIATQTDRGLYVPVVKHVEAMDVWQAATEMQRVTGSARDGTATLDDLSGSTFTITSLGRDGGLGATPIINHPEVGILGVHKARDMPVARSGSIVIRRIMNLSSSWDHRIVDGADGAALVQDLKKMLENPALIFM